MFATHLGSVARKKGDERVLARSDASSSETKLLWGMWLFRLLMPAELDQGHGWDNKSIQSQRSFATSSSVSIKQRLKRAQHPGPMSCMSPYRREKPRFSTSAKLQSKGVEHRNIDQALNSAFPGSSHRYRCQRKHAAHTRWSNDGVSTVDRPKRVIAHPPPVELDIRNVNTNNAFRLNAGGVGSVTLRSSDN